MPKSGSAALSSTNQSQDPSDKKLTDVALRKKKNADAQAAFRARRANYIATLEETVNTLENVVVQLQESCGSACDESRELQKENSRLKHVLRERERVWRTLWQERKSADDPLPLSNYFPSLQSLDEATSHMNKYESGDIVYPMSSDAPGNNVVYGPNPSHFTNQRSSLSCPPASPFSYSTSESPWSPSITQSTSPGGDPAADHSSHFAVSPSTSGPFSPGDQKVPLSSLNTAPYSFPSSRSISPTISTPNSSSSTLVTPFQFTFPDSIAHDSSDNTYRRHPHPHVAEITLIGGTADVSFARASGDAVRYGDDPGNRSRFSVMHENDTNSQQGEGGNEGGAVPYLLSRLRSRRGLADARSRSPSPTTPVLSSTVAVIKAQAFGALRRTRARTKKSSEGAAKVAMNVLKTRGISTNAGPPSATPSLKRQRHDDHLNLYA